ncbi:MAG TPA: hypothetical protein VFC51_00390 [Chloroflexota bacterium]|nr:hypothetical protein [Chloroflexota bacterium]
MRRLTLVAPPDSFSGIEAMRTARGWPSRAPVLLSIAAMALSLIGSAAGFFIPGVYRDAPVWAAAARGSDLVNLVMALPTLAASMILARRGSIRGQLVWLGALGYLLYAYAIYAFDVAFNELFLVYVAALGLVFWALVTLLPQVHPSVVYGRRREGMPRRLVAGYLVVVASATFALWVRQDIQALVSGVTPAGVRAAGIPTDPVHVLDLAFFLPILWIAGVRLWQGKPTGYLLAGALLPMVVFVGTSAAAAVVIEGASSSGAAGPAVGLALVAGAGLVLGVAFLGHLHEGRLVAVRPGPPGS